MLADHLAKKWCLPPFCLESPYVIIPLQMQKATWQKWHHKLGDSKSKLVCTAHLFTWSSPLYLDAVTEMLPSQQYTILKLWLNIYPTNSYLYCIKAAPSATCNCGQVDTIQHHLLACPVTLPIHKAIWGNFLPTLRTALYGTKEDPYWTLLQLWVYHQALHWKSI
jgi:hypothetical protein